MDNLLNDLVARMKEEISEHMRTGRVPTTVQSFSELHDYVDANCYGGLCEDNHLDNLIELFGGRDEHEEMPDGLLNLINKAQDDVDEWLRNR